MLPINLSERVTMNEQFPLVLSWKKITGWTKPSIKAPKPKKLLDDVYGMARTGCLTAVVSPSGGGKTTLLAILSGRYKGSVEGQIQLNGHGVSEEIMSDIAGFVCQKYQLLDNLTVQEHLTFMARLKMDEESSESSREKNVLRVVENLVLSHRMNVKLTSLSGGQKKRLALAVQLLTEPRILFCDEPTTGLDSYSAVTVVKLLRRLADQGKMIICAVHQPASGIFEMFDEVSLLAANGSLAYHGSVTQVYSYFERLGLPCPENYNLCEFIVSKVTVRPTVFKETFDDRGRVEKLVTEFRNSTICGELMKSLEEATDNKLEVSSTFRRIRKIGHHRVGVHVQFAWLFWRSVLLLKRSYKTWAIRFLLYMFVYSCLSLPYGHIVIDQTGVQNMQGLLNCIQIELLYASMYGVIYVMPDQLAVFVQETADHTYSPFPYYLSHLIILSTKAVFEAFIFANFAFGVTGLNSSFGDYFRTVRPVILLAITASAYGFFLSTAFESITTASLFSVPFELVSNVFAGLYIRLRSLPSYIVWLKYLSLSYYTYEALSVDQWVKHPYIACYKEDISECYLNGDQVLESYGFSRSHIYLDYLGLVVYTIVLHTLGFTFLLRKLKKVAAY